MYYEGNTRGATIKRPQSVQARFSTHLTGVLSNYTARVKRQPLKSPLERHAVGLHGGSSRRLDDLLSEQPATISDAYVPERPTTSITHRGRAKKKSPPKKKKGGVCRASSGAKKGGKKGGTKKGGVKKKGGAAKKGGAKKKGGAAKKGGAKKKGGARKKGGRGKKKNQKFIF